MGQRGGKVLGNWVVTAFVDAARKKTVFKFGKSRVRSTGVATKEQGRARERRAVRWMLLATTTAIIT